MAPAAKFAFATTDAEEIWKDPGRRRSSSPRHGLHAELAVATLRAGKHVFVEKPLCIAPGSWPPSSSAWPSSATDARS
jgi:hypothetical protein